jgi:carotenoid cleavage dioxygenase-like enzyme
MNLSSGQLEVYFQGPRYLVQECVFIPRHGGTEEADGYMMVLLNNYDEMISELAVLDTRRLDTRSLGLSCRWR